MMPYFSSVAPPSEPQGWDAAEILELENPATKRWSCPTTTKRARRCENVVSQDRRIKVTPMISEIANGDAAVVVRDEHRELTDLAETMLCHVHRRAADKDEKIRGVVALWKNHIKTSMRSQAQPSAVRYNPRAPATAYQPSRASSSGLPRRLSITTLEQTATMPDVQTRPWPTVPGTSSSSPQSPTPYPTQPPPHYNYGATFDAAFDADALRHLTGEFSRLTLENQTLKDANRRLRAQNAQLVDREKTAAAEHRRTKGELEAVGDARSVLSEQVDGLYEEINRLRSQEDRNLERMTAVEDSAQQGSRARRRRKKVWTAASVVPKKEEED